MACRWETGRCPSSRDALHIAVKNGSRSSMHSLRIVVGMGSRLHDFDGEHMITSRTSSSVHARKFESDVTAVGRILGSGWPIVALWTDSTLSLKNLRNPSAVRMEGGGVPWFVSRLPQLGWCAALARQSSWPVVVFLLEEVNVLLSHCLYPFHSIFSTPSSSVTPLESSAVASDGSAVGIDSDSGLTLEHAVCSGTNRSATRHKQVS